MNGTVSAVSVLLVCLRLSAIAWCSDWPTYRHDNTRAGSTDDKLRLPLQERWSYAAPSVPRRAWSGPEGRMVEGRDLFDRVKFDDAIHVAVVDDRVYFGSSVDHKVYCREAKTGRELWSFFTEAPVRLAPTVDSGRVYVGSDDGYAYCLRAKDGQLIWKLRLGPAEEWLLARGEMISRWPVRTGVLVDRGIAYFGAGVFPHENVYLAAVNAADGNLIWKNGTISHGDAGRVDLSPRGYLLASNEGLWVPSGRTRPWGIDRASGTVFKAKSTSIKVSSGTVAGTNALVADGRLFTHTLGAQVAGSAETLYATTGEALVRLDRKAYSQATNKIGKMQNALRDLYRKRREMDTAEYERQVATLRKDMGNLTGVGVVWRTPCKLNSCIVIVGETVVVGGQDQVALYAASTGNELSRAKVAGNARGLAVASGRLFVSTTAGNIYCFDHASPELRAKDAAGDTQAADAPYPQDEWAAVYEAAATQILERTGITRGFCLVLGSETGRLAFELAKRSELRIYGIEPDPQKVDAARQALSSAGLYGHRVTIHQRAPTAIPYSNYFANLIVSDTFVRTGRIPGDPAALVRHLTPCGGMVCLGQPAKQPALKTATKAPRDLLTKMGLGEQARLKTIGTWATLTRGKLPGAGSWPHQYGEPGNTACGDDKRVGGGLGVLWYGDPGPAKMVNRHAGAVGPVSTNGRLFVQGETSIMAYDAYNGLLLWEYEDTEARRTGVKQNQTPGNLTASDDSLFVMMAHEVRELDAATGKVKTRHRLPKSKDDGAHVWSYVAYKDGLLFGTATRSQSADERQKRRGSRVPDVSDAIFAIDTAKGEHLWSYPGNSISQRTIALGPRRIFFIDGSITSQKRAQILRQDKNELKALSGEEAKRAEERLKRADVRLAVALDSRTGQQLWSFPVDVTDCSGIGAGGGKLTLMYRNDVLILGGANANGHFWKQFLAGEFKRRRLVALSAANGYRLWAKDANYRHRPIIVGKRVIAEPWAFDLLTGEQVMRAHPLTGNEVPWSYMRPGHHCGMNTATANMLFFRSGYTGFYDLQSDTGTRHFAGQRLGCWVNAIPANGLVMIPEASVGCVCMFSIAATIVLEPRTPRRPWSIHSSVGPTTPVRQMALNLGAPGDRRDAKGKLWLSYPRPSDRPRNPSTNTTGLALVLDLAPQFVQEGGFFSRDGDATERSGTDAAWLFSSGARGMTRCSIPLLGKDDDPATYAVRLYFAGDKTDKRGRRVFDVLVQGKTVLKNVDVAVQANVPKMGLVRELAEVAVTSNLVIEFVPKVAAPSPAQVPMLSAIEVYRTGASAK